VLGKVETAQPHVVVGWPIGGQGRKLFAGAALFSAQGELLAISHQTCVLVTGGVPLGLNRWATSSKDRTGPTVDLTHALVAARRGAWAAAMSPPR
jgi:hypothetical protein